MGRKLYRKRGTGPRPVRCRMSLLQRACAKSAWLVSFPGQTPGIRERDRDLLTTPTLHVRGALIGMVYQVSSVQYIYSMGKWRAKRRRGRSRPQPTGLPSVKQEVQQQQLKPAKANKTVILNQVRVRCERKIKVMCMLFRIGPMYRFP